MGYRPFKGPFEYAYADKYKGTNTKKRGPVGITGFIRFLKPNTKFDLTLRSLLSRKKTKFDADGKTSALSGLLRLNY